MAIKPYNVAIGVRVKFNNKFEPKCIGDENLLHEDILYITQERVSNMYVNEEIKYYVYIGGGSHTQSGTAFLDELDLEFPYDVSDMIKERESMKDILRKSVPDNHSNVFILNTHGEIEKCYYSDGYFQRGTTGMNFLTLRDINGWLYQKDLVSLLVNKTEKIA